MVVGIIVLLSTDGLLAIVGWMAARSRRAESYHGFPLGIAVIMCCIALALHLTAYGFLASMVFQDRIWRPDPLLMALNGISGLMPAVVYGYLLLQAASGVFTRAIYGGSPNPMPETFAEARRRFLAGDVEGSLAEYRRMMETYPDSIEPALALAGVLQAVNREMEAAKVLREALPKFENRSEDWVRAAHRLLLILKGPFEQPIEAALLEKQIETRLRRIPAAQTPKNAAPSEHRHKAEERLVQADVDGAIEHFRSQFAANPSSPRPLIAAAAALERDGRFFDAADILREIIQRFQRDDVIWSDAAYRLALLHETHLGEQTAAKTLYRQIVERTPRTKAGHLAGARLSRYLTPPPDFR